MRKYKLHSTHFLFALLWVCGLSACSPQQRLTRLLREYPELKVRDTLIQAIVPIEALSHDTLLCIGSAATPCPDCDSLLRASLRGGVSVTAGRARATLAADTAGLRLTAEQLPDTIVREVSVPVVEYVAVEREKPERPMRTFFRISGIIAWSVLALLLALRIIRLFCKV